MKFPWVEVGEGTGEGTVKGKVLGSQDQGFWIWVSMEDSTPPPTQIWH